MANEAPLHRTETPSNSGGPDLGTIYKTVVFDIPVALAHVGLGLPPERKTVDAVWAGYDTAVRWATAAVDSLYRSQALSQLFGNTVNHFLRWQHLGSAARNLITTSVGHALGLPTSAEIHTLTTKIQALETQLAHGLGTRNPRPAKRRRSSSPKAHELTPLPSPPVSVPVQTLHEAA